MFGLALAHRAFNGRGWTSKQTGGEAQRVYVCVCLCCVVPIVRYSPIDTFKIGAGTSALIQ